MGDQPGRNGRAHRAGLREVAEAAGVSLATVDRVLNERGSASTVTARRVIEAARNLGLRRTLPRPYRRMLRLEVMMARSETPFFDRFTEAVMQVACTLDRSVIVGRSLFDEEDSRLMASRIRASRADGLVLYGPEHREIIEALGAVAERIPVVCVVTDVPSASRLAYVGIDHERAGRTAGLLCARIAGGSGDALVVTQRAIFRAHEARVAGFTQALATYAPAMRVAEVLEGHDEREWIRARLRAALRRHAEVAAIYNTGGWNDEVAAALRDAGLAGRVPFVGHELNACSAGLLREGVMTLAIDQAPELQARRSIEVLLKALGALPPDGTGPEIPFTLHTAENC